MQSEGFSMVRTEEYAKGVRFGFADSKVNSTEYGEGDEWEMAHEASLTESGYREAFHRERWEAGYRHGYRVGLRGEALEERFSEDPAVRAALGLSKQALAEAGNEASELQKPVSVAYKSPVMPSDGIDTQADVFQTEDEPEPCDLCEMRLVPLAKGTSCRVCGKTGK